MLPTPLLLLLKKPTVIIIIIMTVAIGGLYVNNSVQDGKISKLKGQIAQIEANFDTCKNNEHTFRDAINKCNGAADSWATSNMALQIQIEEAQAQVAYWQQQYDEKLCLNNDDETPVVPSQGKVVKDEKSVDAVNRLNDIFAD